MTSHDEPIRQLVNFSGHVQGVGFRYTAERIARPFRITGYVRNLADGRVELVAEGAADEVTRYVAELRSAMADHIRHIDVHTLAATGEFSGFGIRH